MGLQFDKINYAIRYPDGFESNKKYPLLLFLHGAGTRGQDVNLIEQHPFFLETEDKDIPAICVAPQCYANTWFEIFEQLLEFVRYWRTHENVDQSRIYLMGASMGGYCAWQLAMTRPEWFTAMVPICGGGMYWNAPRLKALPIWAFHGSEDATVLPRESEKMVSAVNRVGGNAKLTIYEGVAHNAWTPTFQNEKMWDWLFSQKSLSTTNIKAGSNEKDTLHWG